VYYLSMLSSVEACGCKVKCDQMRPHPSTGLRMLGCTVVPIKSEQLRNGECGGESVQADDGDVVSAGGWESAGYAYGVLRPVVFGEEEAPYPAALRDIV